MNMSDLPVFPLTAHLPPGGGEWRFCEPMAKHVTWRAGGIADRTYTPSGLDDLCRVLRAVSGPILFVGLGSNLLVRDGGYRGTVILTHRALTGLTLLGRAPDGAGLITAGAGVPAPHLAKFAANHNLAGAEWLAGVPGTVGGALAMNAGCYGGETWNHIVQCRTIDTNGDLHTRDARDFAIGYRHVAALSGMHDLGFVDAVWRFVPGDREAARSEIKALLARRVATQPLGEPNAGSVFRNPPNDHAARLIETSGLKGLRIGGAEVSRKHANFIVNKGGATALDIESLITEVRRAVLAFHGVALVPEVRIVGELA
jgi:UDP-N-acetylmuramate dehydrogenase